MQDDVEAEAAAKGGKGKGKGRGKAAKAGDGPKNADIQIARMLVRAQWQQEFGAANPDAGQPERKAAWKEARQARLEQHMKSARKVLSSLQRQGVTMALSETAAAADPEADGDDDDSES